MIWRFALLTALAAFAASSHVEQAESEELIQRVNNAKTTWTAGRNFPEGTSKAQIKRLLGLKRNGEKSVLPKKEVEEDDQNVEIPDAFDARQQWPNCTSISHIRDQSDCGSCWAVSVSGAFSDRLCIASKGKLNLSITAYELISCCSECGGGCDGGYPGVAWYYIKTHGLVTGGDYGSGEGCQPYPLQPCEHHTTGPRIPCPDMGDPPTPPCKRKCTNASYKKSFKQDHYKAESAYYIDSSVKEIQKEIMIHGPVEAGFSVYEDFLSYKSGVYKHVTGEEEGGHAVRIIGWGKESGIPYWLVANSWNNDWGENGYFKILRGRDECGIESSINAGIPRV